MSDRVFLIVDGSTAAVIESIIQQRISVLDDMARQWPVLSQVIAKHRVQLQAVAGQLKAPT